VVFYFTLSETLAMNPSSHADSRLRWQARIDAPFASGLTTTQFCQQHHYSFASFYQWKRKLASTHSPVTPPTANPIAPNGNPFQRPLSQNKSAGQEAAIEIDATTLSLILSGIELGSAQRRKRYTPAA
jgi:hypothetical protein